MDHHSRQLVYLKKGDPSCCDLFPTCEHPSEWATECTECGEQAKSDNFLGTYHCDSCGMNFWALVEGWVDKRNED